MPQESSKNELNIKIWVFDKDPKRCALYYPDDLLKPTIWILLNAFYRHPSEWHDWIYKYKANWVWAWQLVNELIIQLLKRSKELEEGYFALTVMELLDQHYQNQPFVPSHPRGLKSKFPKYAKQTEFHDGKVKNKQIIHEYRRHFNRTRNNEIWSYPSEEPFWYYGNIH
jgi:hypothetical protein